MVKMSLCVDVCTLIDITGTEVSKTDRAENCTASCDLCFYGVQRHPAAQRNITRTTHECVFVFKSICIVLTRRDTTTPWTQGLWTRRASCTSCLGPTTSSTWRVTGCPPAPSKRCEERERLTRDTNNNHKHVFCCGTNKPYLVCVCPSVCPAAPFCGGLCRGGAGGRPEGTRASGFMCAQEW